MKRVMIVGGSGSGKSTLARALGARTGLPVYHMDHIHWQPGWEPRPTEARKAMALAVENRDAWIFEGGFSTTQAHRLSRADTFIWIDLPVSLRLWRVTRRMVMHWGRTRPDLPDGCPEGFHGETLDFYRWIWRTRNSNRDRLLQLMAGAHDGVTLHHLTTRAQVRMFLEHLPC